LNRAPASNPFSTRFIRPGATTYRFPEGISAASLAEKFFAQHQGRAAIVGPHGSGKTSLLYALAPYLGSIVDSHLCDGDPAPNDLIPIQTQPKLDPLRIYWFRLMVRSREKTPNAHVNQTPQRDSLHALMRSRHHWTPDTLVVIDGWEQIRWPLRGWVYWNAKRSQTKLLVTSHQKTILPTLWDSQVRPEIAQQVIRDLLAASQTDSAVVPRDWTTQVCDPSQLQKAIAENHGSLREVLFNLYDSFEHTCRSEQQKGS
jgi:GTPase SAR1 family protein